MESLNILHLLDFAPLFQLAAGFFIVFVVIDYSKSFSAVLSLHLFDYKNAIQKKVKELRVSEDSIETLGEVEYFKTNGRKDYVRQKTEIREHNKSADEIVEKMGKYVDNNCRYDMFRYICINMFVYCITAMFYGGLKTDEILWLHSFGIYVVVTGIIMVVAAFTGYFCRDTSNHNNLLLLCTLLLSAILGVLPFFIADYHLGLSIDSVESLTNWLIVLSVLLPYALFILYIFFTMSVYLSIRKELNSYLKKLSESKEEIEKKQKDMEGLKNTMERNKALEEADPEIPCPVETEPEA